MKQTVVVTGIKKIDKRIKSLEFKIQKKIVRDGIRAGMKIMLAEVKRQAPVDTGLTRKSFKLGVPKKRTRGLIKLNVRVTAGVAGLVKQSKQGKRTFYPAAVEFGAKGRKAHAAVRFFAPKAKVYGDGSIPPNPFVRRAYSHVGKQSRDVAIQAMLTGIQREASKP